MDSITNNAAYKNAAATTKDVTDKVGVMGNNAAVSAQKVGVQVQDKAVEAAEAAKKATGITK